MFEKSNSLEDLGRFKFSAPRFIQSISKANPITKFETKKTKFVSKSPLGKVLIKSPIARFFIKPFGGPALKKKQYEDKQAKKREKEQSARDIANREQAAYDAQQRAEELEVQRQADLVAQKEVDQAAFEEAERSDYAKIQEELDAEQNTAEEDGTDNLDAPETTEQVDSSNYDDMHAISQESDEAIVTTNTSPYEADTGKYAEDFIPVTGDESMVDEGYAGALFDLGDEDDYYKEIDMREIRSLGADAPTTTAEPTWYSQLKKELRPLRKQIIPEVLRPFRKTPTQTGTPAQSYTDDGTLVSYEEPSMTKYLPYALGALVLIGGVYLVLRKKK